MKSLKAQLMAAIAMTLVAALTIGSSTFAWFSMNTTVTASGMEVKAASEGGIVIAPYSFNDTVGYTAPDDSAYGSSATGTRSLPTTIDGLYPTSTKTDLSKWYHATSTSVDSYAADTSTYSELSIGTYTTGGEPKGYDSDNNYYFLMNKFAVKSLDPATDTSNENLYVAKVTVTQPAKAGSADLDKSLRVAVKCGSTTLIFAPIYNTSDTVEFYYYNGTTRTKNGSVYKGNGIALTDTAQISSEISTTPKAIEVYMYYEGEDTNCKSINAIDIDTLSLDIRFSTLST